MQALWRHGEATVRTVRDDLQARTGRPYAYTTVLTVVVRLHERRLVVRRKQGRTYVYRPTADEQGTLEALSGRAVDQLLERYGTSALRHFAERLQDVDPSLRAQLIKLAARRRTTAKRRTGGKR